jgi:putative hydrolase of the HAD superfamily
MAGIRVVAFDGDDTLWHNESMFSVTQEDFRSLLAPYSPRAPLDERLIATERRNLDLFGYGIKSFILSMIETAIEVTEGRITADDIQRIIDRGRAMLVHPVELLEGVRPALETIGQRHRLMLITKGDLFDQESKVARSGLGDLFWKVEIVSEKDPAAYRRILAEYEIAPEDFLMAGNSLRSDVLPVLEIGAYAAHIPYHTTWALERVEEPVAENGRFFEMTSIGQLPGLVAHLHTGSEQNGHA